MRQIDEILIVSIDDTLYGINTEYIHYILKVVPITPMSFAHKSIRGLCAIEGGVRPLFDLSILIGEESFIDDKSPKSRILVIEYGRYSFFLLVGGVINNIEVQQDKIEYIEDDNASTIALYKYENNIIQILELKIFIRTVSLRMGCDFDIPEINFKDTNLVKKKIYKSPLERNQKHLLFRMLNEYFALNLRNIREVINVPDDFIDLAETTDEVTGMFSLRDELIVVIDLRVHFHFPPTVNIPESRIIIAQYHSKVVGLIVDELINIVTIHINKITPFPDNFQDDMLEGIVHIDNYLISVINESEIKSIINKNHHVIDQTFTKMANSIARTNNPDIEVVIFSLGYDDYAFNIEDVFEIIDFESSQVTQIPNVSEFIKGLMSIRGKVIPIVSLYYQLGIEERAVENRRILVVSFKNEFIGFVVDRVLDIRNIFASEIKRDEEKESYFAEVIELEESRNIILLFNTEYLFSISSLTFKRELPPEPTYCK